MATTAPARYHLDFVRTVEGMAAGSDMRWTVDVNSVAEAIKTLGYYRNEDSTISVTAYDQGTWFGSGRAGHGSVMHNLDMA